MESHSSESLDVLAMQKSRQERQEVSMEDLCSESLRFASAVACLVEREMKTVTIEGQKLGDFFWDENEQGRHTGKSEEQCRVGTRIRRRGGSISFEWYRNSFYSTGPGETKKQIRSKWIKQTTKGSYSMSTFKKEPQWAKEIIEMIEGRYNVLRKRNTALKELRQALIAYQKLVEESHGM